ncbi:MAG TPA: CHASE2 domain-containing protein [Rubrivivax sp.]|nr:CHASE2 domain-containing protein [Rubrivivax sp.]
MNAAGSHKPAGGRPGRIRLIGAALLVALALFVWLKGTWAERLQAAWFDAHQSMWPRQVATLPVTVVAIDQASLVEIGQWPWPRNVLASLVRIIQRAEPAAIGINILMPEADALSPERLLAQAQVEDKTLAAALRALPTHDADLARAMAMAPTVLAVAGTSEAGRQVLRAAPVTVHSVRAAGNAMPPGAPGVPMYSHALTSIDELDRKAGGWGLISVESSRGVIRRMPTVASIGGTLVPALALEMLRVAQRAPSLRLALSGSDMRSVTVGRLNVPTEADGAVRVYFSPHLDQRFVSAVDVLDGRVREADLRGQLVLIGLTGVALQEYQNTPIGGRMSGSEIHAQLLENLLEGTLLRRPAWANAAEALLLLVLGGLLLWATPRWRTHHAALLLLGCVFVPVLAAIVAFRTHYLLFDALTPGLCLLLFFGVLLALTLADATRQGRALQRLVQAQREDSARISGELQAAQRVQTATLPRADLLQADHRVELHATLQPAREVGGDLYDYFMLDERRLFLLIGDVAGKGLSASIFMAVSKALYKSAMLRAPDADIGAIMSVANAEVSRDNPGSLFVTAFAAILDLQSGEMHYCNAGHDNPYRLHGSHAAPLRIDDGDGPPLCAMAGYDYRGARCKLLPGETLCLMTDGVTEAQTAAGELYGNERLQHMLLELQRNAAGVRELVEALHADVMAFSTGAEPADDLTILALRWNGPAERAR